MARSCHGQTVPSTRYLEAVEASGSGVICMHVCISGWAVACTPCKQGRGCTVPQSANQRVTVVSHDGPSQMRISMEQGLTQTASGPLSRCAGA